MELGVTVPIKVLAMRRFAKSLEGNWRPALLLVLQQEVEIYDIYQ